MNKHTIHVSHHLIVVSFYEVNIVIITSIINLQVPRVDDPQELWDEIQALMDKYKKKDE